MAQVRVKNAGEAVTPLYRLAVAERDAALKLGNYIAWEKWSAMSVELAGVLGLLGCWPVPETQKD